MTDLSKEKGTSRSLNLILKNHFTHIPKKLREYLITLLSKKNEALDDLILAILTNFDDLPHEIRNLLPKIFKSIKINERTIWAFALNFDKISSEQEISKDIISFIRKNFYKLSEDIIVELVSKLSQKEEYALIAMEIIVYNHRDIPKTVQDKLISRMFFCFEDIEEDLSILVTELIIMLIRLKDGKMRAVRLISKNINFLNKKFVLNTLRILSKDPQQEIRSAAYQLILEY